MFFPILALKRAEEYVKQILPTVDKKGPWISSNKDGNGQYALTYFSDMHNKYAVFFRTVGRDEHKVEIYRFLGTYDVPYSNDNILS